ncbi:hypothetical protein [Marichromatium bheemlicum]|uniref:Uncharacterized protein n=1 Tax=Marichromatium bheemlicum TaxID=365339 RepID=A0ABX1IAS8_9GAMM|nr:hypothetical protein [Marichromatium bheemlicum]NKN34642.1 hypothetical protein [Marichromatium bheemlicum]
MRQLGGLALMGVALAVSPVLAEPAWPEPSRAVVSPYQQGFEQAPESSLTPPRWERPMGTDIGRETDYRFRPWDRAADPADSASGYRFRQPTVRAETPWVMSDEGMRYRFRPLSERERGRLGDRHDGRWRPSRVPNDAGPPAPLGWPMPGPDR